MATKTNSVHSTYRIPLKRTLQLEVIKSSENNYKKIYSSVKFRIFTAIFLGITTVSLYTRVQLTEIMEQIDQINKETVVAESEELRLKINLEDRNNVINVEEAAEKLGMKKIQKYQIEYINVPCNEEIKVKNED